jgi:short-subunit dehydrogenase
MNRRGGFLVLGLGLAALMAARANARSRRVMNFHNRTILITGGSRGLGLVMARKFAQKGANLALVARDAEELARAREDLSVYNAEVLTVVCDVTNHAQVDRMLAQVRDRFGDIDVVINNAGTIQVGPMEEMTYADYDEAMQTHFYAPLYIALAVLPEMRRRKSGRIINISSIGGKISVPHLLPYSASKFALVGLSEGMRSELAKDNIYVTTVCPGLLRTGSHVNARFKGQHRAEYTLFSIGDSLPFTSTDAETAAKQIVTACKYGDAELVISVPAILGERFHALFPGATADLLGAANGFLPGPGGIGTAQVTGRESQSMLAPSLLTALSDRATRDNNE